MKKPTGRNGFMRIQAGQDGTAEGTYHQLQLPDAKADVERRIAEWFVSAMAKASQAGSMEPMFWDVQANVENDFDFTVSTPRGAANLELQEIAPLTGPYDSAPKNYKPYDFAKYILEKIRSKSMKYGPQREQQLFLLTYVTHWSFHLSPTTINCLRAWLAVEPLAFNAVFTFTPIHEGEGDVRWLYPVPPEMREGFDPESVRDNVTLNLDAAKFAPIQERGD
jgi:hypothetical protein